MCSHEQLYAGIAQRMRESTSRTLYGEAVHHIREDGFFVEAKADEIAIYPMGVPMFAYHDYGVWFVWERRADQPNVFFACEHSLEQALRTAATKMVTQNLRQGLSADVAVELHLLANAVATEPEVPMKLNRPRRLIAREQFRLYNQLRHHAGLRATDALRVLGLTPSSPMSSAIRQDLTRIRQTDAHQW